MTVVCIGEFEMDSYLQKVATDVCRAVKKKKEIAIVVFRVVKKYCYCVQNGEKGWDVGDKPRGHAAHTVQNTCQPQCLPLAGCQRYSLPVPVRYFALQKLSAATKD